MASSLIAQITTNERVTVPYLRYWLIPLLDLLVTRSILVVTTVDSADLLHRLLPSTVDIVTDTAMPNLDKTYNYAFLLDPCSKSFLNVAEHTVFGYSTKEVPTLDGFAPPLGYPQYTTEAYSDPLYFLAQQVARRAYITPGSRLVVLVGDKGEVEAIKEILVGLPADIVVVQREEGILLSSRLEADYVFDMMTKQVWGSTLTGGRRRRQGFVSKREADEALVFGCRVDRMITIHDYDLLPVDNTYCKIRQVPSGVDPGFFEMSNLGPRPARLLWRWYQDGMSLFPMISLVALLDSIDETPYFQYPVETASNRGEYLAIRRYHRDRYFAEFSGSNDVEVLINIWLSLIGYPGRSTTFDMIPATIQTWALQHSIDDEKMFEVYSLVSRLLSYFGETNTDFGDPYDFIEAIRPYIEEIYRDSLVRKIGSLYQDGKRSYLPVGTDFTMVTDPPISCYALVVSNSNPSLLWISFPVTTTHQAIQPVIAVV